MKDEGSYVMEITKAEANLEPKSKMMTLAVMVQEGMPATTPDTIPQITLNPEPYQKCLIGYKGSAVRPSAKAPARSSSRHRGGRLARDMLRLGGLGFRV